MLIAVDLGNTNITFGIFDGADLLYTARMATNHNRTADEYGFFLKQAIREAKDGGQVTGAIVSSVVPVCNYSIDNTFKKHFDISPTFINADINTGVQIMIDNKYELGADNIANAAGASNLYEGDLIVVDFGTATTFSAITADHKYLGGAICCGVRTSLNAISSLAAKLPWVTLSSPKRAIGTNTVDCMHSGTVYGYAGLVDGLVERMKNELPPNVTTIATGGLANTVAPFSKNIDIVNKELTLEGLRVIYEKNKA